MNLIQSKPARPPKAHHQADHRRSQARSTCSVQTAWGKFQLSISNKGLCELRFPINGQATSQGNSSAGRMGGARRNIAVELKRYVKGFALRPRRLKIDTSVLTPMQRRVLRALQDIPCGEVRSYQWLAERVGKKKGARAVGKMLGSSPIPIIFPCHRIIRSDGRLGGFSAGIRWKRKLLAHEQQARKDV